MEQENDEVGANGVDDVMDSSLPPPPDASPNNSIPEVPPPAPRIKQEMNDEEEEHVVMTDADQPPSQDDTTENDGGAEHKESEPHHDVDMPTAVSDSEHEIAQADYTKANKMKFAFLCQAMEDLWEKKQASGAERWTTPQKLEKLLPKKLLDRLDGGDAYPILRLIMPQIDTARPNLGMQETTIGKAWSTALGLGKDSVDDLKLKKYTDPKLNKNSTGDLSLTVQEVVADRYPKKKSPTTIGEINDLLDQLVLIKGGIAPGGPRTHDWRNTADTDNTTADKKDKVSNADLRAEWVKRLLQIPLSPLEHKWIVRILLNKVEIGIGHKTILKYLSPYAEDLYNANNSLKRLCAAIFDKEWVRRRKERDQREALERQQVKWDKYMPRTSAVASLGNTISPMLANRTTFESALADIETRHLKFAKELSEEDDKDSNKFANALALKFPPFICEVKLDGERMLIHVNRGNVTIQTRNSKWYSNIYSPVLAPAVRAAIQKYDVDVILDGEVIAWDDGRQEVIPFGSNRTVANDRRKWLKKHGMVEERDVDQHKGETENNVMNPNDYYNKKMSSAGNSVEIGAKCWLNYIVFDILYVGGPDASKLISEATSLTGDEIPIGSILNLSGFNRKKILYCLIEPQEHQVELMPSLVVRRNGQSEKADDYFSPTSPCMEAGLPCTTVDSLQCIVKGDIRDWEDLDEKARGSKSDVEIAALRVKAMNEFYVEIVENQGLEGLIFKDLLAPYVLSSESRGLRYWNKMKPDYATDGHSASDIDAVILGAYYATGMAKAGVLNAFLVGCVDESNPDQFMTLCKVNGGSVDKEKLNGILSHTGYEKKDDGTVSYGKWFQGEGKTVPDFISERSFQTGHATQTGWVCQAKKYPDLWIHPEESFVVTLNSGEVTSSDEFSAGVSLRFPRITKVRIESIDGDVKTASEVETRENLYQLFAVMDARRKEGSLEFESGSASDPGGSVGATRFLSTADNTKKKKARPRKGAAESQVLGMPVVEKKASAALAGVTFVVLEGHYSLDENSLDAEQAKAEGWYEDAKKVKRARDVQEYISRHSGTTKAAISSDTDVILGGRKNDARIVTHARMLDSDDVATKTDPVLPRLRELGGIVKWTYVFSSVRQWIDEASQVKVEDIGVGSPSRQQLALGGPPTIPNTQLARQSRHDYLVLGKHAVLDEHGDVFGIQLWKKDISIFEFKRGLQEVEKSRGAEFDSHPKKKKKTLKLKLAKDSAKKDSFVPWQYAAIDSLPVQDRWVVRGDIENLWNFKTTAVDDTQPTVVYPDLFGNDFGFKKSADVLEQVFSMIPTKRWDDLSEEAQMSSLASSLPLARIMGAQVTPHLHNGVTHVLCLLKGRDTATWKADSFEPELFEDEERALQLHRRLLDLHHKDSKPVIVKFVSPNWIREQFDGTVVI